MDVNGGVTEDPWQALRALTRARIAQGRCGASLPTAAVLAFDLAHAQARDAVHLPLAVDELVAAEPDAICVHSAAATREVYLRRPDLGRRLDEASRARLQAAAGPAYDIVFVLADGLSACALHRHALALLRHTRALLPGWRIAPLIVAEQARVALGDEIGALIHARQVAMLIGERPGLSSADSLGVYLTHAPRVGRTDAERNCISNIGPEGGLSPERAAHTLAWLLHAAQRRQLSGVALKDESDSVVIAGQGGAGLAEPP